VSRIAKSLLTLVAAATLAGTAAPAFADDDPPADPTPACYAVDGTPIFDLDVCAEQARQASGH
jgi:hypothetical protein